jgi:hypothetical protein
MNRPCAFLILAALPMQEEKAADLLRLAFPDDRLVVSGRSGRPSGIWRSTPPAAASGSAPTPSGWGS